MSSAGGRAERYEAMSANGGVDCDSRLAIIDDPAEKFSRVARIKVGPFNDGKGWC